MENAVRIEGIEYAPCEIHESGGYWGIKTPEKTFWVFPGCDDEGREVRSLPPFLPVEIRSVTIETPDLTREHPETIKELFDKRRSYFNMATLQTYLSQYPNERWLTEEQFLKARLEILAEPLDDFARSRFARQLIWDRHGTRQLANQHGYPVLPALYLMGASVIMVVLLLYRTQTTWPGLVIVLAGVPVYFVWTHWPGKGSATGRY